MSAAPKRTNSTGGPSPAAGSEAPGLVRAEHHDLAHAPTTILYEDDDCLVRYRGPEGGGGKVVVTFPDLIHPTTGEAPGWGEPLFLKRGLPVVSIVQKRANWFQNAGFFTAMEHIRAAMGPKTELLCYGGSMGGYGAILASAALGATRTVAHCPQFSIDRAVAPFERRYRDEAAKIGRFLWDVTEHFDPTTEYVVLYDPTHRVDRQHRARFPRTPNWVDVVVPGSSHGTLPTLLEMGLSQQIFDLVAGNLSAAEMRRLVRIYRAKSYRYIRRMGNLTFRRHPKSNLLLTDIAKARGFDKLHRKWRPDAAPRPAEVVIHAGLPKTGTSTIQGWLSSNPELLANNNICFPNNENAPPDVGQPWLSAALIGGDFAQLKQVLAAAGRNSERLLLSDESLYLVASQTKPEVARQLRAELAGINVHLVLCERDLLPWKKSFYLQSIRNRRSNSPSQAARLWGTDLVFEQFFEGEFAQTLCDFDAVIRQLAEVFGAATVTRLKMTPNEDILPAFAATIGIEAVLSGLAPRRNPSLADVDGEILRQANAQGQRTSRLIKRLILAGSDAPHFRNPRRAAELRDIAGAVSWDRFQFRENPPLIFTEEKFANRVESLRAAAEHLLKTGSPKS